MSTKPSKNNPTGKKLKQPLNSIGKYVKYSTMAFQMVGVILVGVWIGSLLDEHYATEKPFFTVVFSLLAVTASCILLIRDIQKISKND